jgi:hypothetical protein
MAVPYEAAVMAVLRDYAQSKMSAADAMSLLNICCLEDLFAATVFAGFDLPRPSEQEAERAAAAALRFLEVDDGKQG